MDASVPELLGEPEAAALAATRAAYFAALSQPDLPRRRRGRRTRLFPTGTST